MSYLWYWPSGGWDFERWRDGCSWTPVRGPQSGQKDLRPPIPRRESLQEWEALRPELLRLTCELLGEVSDSPPAEMRWETLEEFPGTSYQLRRIRYSLTDREWGYAWLLLPRETDSPRPAVIALHQTVPQGKDEPVGIEGDPALAYGRELAERGFVVLAPDAVGFGERRMDQPGALYRSADRFFQAHPEGSVMAKMAFDTSRAVDFLERMPEVDSARIGCIGHSHGGYGTLFAMLRDERIRAGVISCGVTPLRTDPTPERWWRRTALIPRLGLYESAMEGTPVDFHQWIALLAPRPVFLSAALNDAIFPNTESLRRLARRARSVYGVYGAVSCLRPWIFHGPHCFPREARTRAYRMLEETFCSFR